MWQRTPLYNIIVYGWLLLYDRFLGVHVIVLTMHSSKGILDFVQSYEKNLTFWFGLHFYFYKLLKNFKYVVFPFQLKNLPIKFVNSLYWNHIHLSLGITLSIYIFSTIKYISSFPIIFLFLLVPMFRKAKWNIYLLSN